ncbi:MAG: hypothetical protein EBU66_14640 [Bacteroidetes bacterium]|nr:hypothetical protein [bacterium]NBP65885.1 hypothetical protein [Bacteroidota bacterium]
MKYSNMQSTLQFIAGQLKKPKERFETILEPLQALLQIGFLAFYPIGSKLTIHNNILMVQLPGYTQNVRRWYNNDKKEDVFYLYNVFSRFNKFYKSVLANGGGENAALFSLLNELAKTGINNLIRTYNQTDKIHILHTLQMYKGMLDNPDLARRLSSAAAPAPTATENHTLTSGVGDDEDLQFPRRIVSSKSSSSSPPLRPMTSGGGGGSGSGVNVPMDTFADTNIDLIFIKITEMYSQEDYTIIYHTLLKIQNDTQYYLNYIEGLNKILEPVNIRIKKWIDDNIVF